MGDRDTQTFTDGAKTPGRDKSWQKAQIKEKKVEEMKIITALKTKRIRLALDNAWLFWDESSEEWTVYTRRYSARKNTTLYSGASLEDAIDALIRE